MTQSHFDAELEAELLAQDHRNMLVQHGQTTPLREGMHASAVLDKEFCLREQVLHQLYPEQGEKEPWGSWDWRKSAIYENGWMFHRRVQQLHARFGNVVWTPVSEEQAHDIMQHIPPALHKYYVKFDMKIEGKPTRWLAAELDLTHFDADRNLFFSPDMITMFGGQRYIWELKGINQDAFSGNIRYDASGNQIELYDARGKKIKVQEGLTEELEQACAANETVHKAREQVNLYLHLLGMEFGVIFVEDKASQNFKLWVIEYEAERAYPYTNRLNDIKGRTTLVRAHGASKLPLPCCKSSSESRARKCPMRTKCFQLQESEDW